MSVSDLGALASLVQGLLERLPSVDVGMILATAGMIILGVFTLYVAGVILYRFLVWLANLTPAQFTRFMLVLGIVLLVAGMLAP